MYVLGRALSSWATDKEAASLLTDPLTILAIRNPSIDKLYAYRNFQSTYFEALELGKCRPFPALEFQNLSYDIHELHKFHRYPDLEALKLWQGRSGNPFPTSLFTILELQNQSHDVPELYKTSYSPDIQALKLWKGPSGLFTPVSLLRYFEICSVACTLVDIILCST